MTGGPLLCASSDLRDNAEERCRSTHGQFVLLGQHHRWSVSLLFILKTFMHRSHRLSQSVQWVQVYPPGRELKIVWGLI